MHTQLQRHRRLQARHLGAGPGDAADAEHPRELRSASAMGYNSARYIHTLYQAMNLAFADRDFYYGDPVLPARGAGAGPAVEGLRDASARSSIRCERNDPRRAARAIRIRSRAATTRSRSSCRTGAPKAPAPTADRARRVRSTSSTAARRASWRPTRRAGSCRSRRAAAGSRR